MPLEIQPDATFEEFVALYAFPPDHPRTRELYAAAQEAAMVYATMTLPPCPSWCGLPTAHDCDVEPGTRTPAFFRFHSTSPDHTLVRIMCLENIEGDDVETGAPFIDLPVVSPADDGFAAGDARRIAAELLDAADLLDEITGAAK
ncbi:MAG TPA: hypothetical protein VG650_13495 [Mycobacteriales bacterium]|nr:hypothetical protein [Mycobacteriales bacterium]